MNTARAVEDFWRLRRRASVEQLLGQLSGHSTDLLSYEEVRQKLKVTSEYTRGRQDIPVDRIVGSVGRYRDFTRTFLPRESGDMERWARVKTMTEGEGGLPPIEVYKLGDTYFVKDGNHRVSVARQIGAKTIEAYVTEVTTKVPPDADDELEDIILKAEYADFLDKTWLDELRPGANLQLTELGQYPKLLEHIEVHRYFMGIDFRRDVAFAEAVTHWYDHVYVPIAELIHELGILRDFSDRTAADLYLWLAEHRALLEERLGWEIKPESALLDLAERVERVHQRPGDRLFDDILVAISGAEDGWWGLELAFQIARREGSRLYGLHVLDREDEREGEAAQAVQAEFERRCREAGISGRLALEVGEVAEQINARSRWTDLVMLNLVHPPPSGLARLGYGLRTVIKRSSRPILVTPPVLVPLEERLLLAFDDSPKAHRALCAAAYLAGSWGLELTVLCVGREGAQALTVAERYLTQRGLQATFLSEAGPIAETIVAVAEQYRCRLIVMGSYSLRGLAEMAFGSSVDGVLRNGQIPVLICP